MLQGMWPSAYFELRIRRSLQKDLNVHGLFWFAEVHPYRQGEGMELKASS
jgi:hypothetical protein